MTSTPLLFRTTTANEEDLNPRGDSTSETPRYNFMLEHQAGFYCYMRNEELKFMHDPGYMFLQTDINDYSRSVLVDRMVSVTCQHQLGSAPLYLAVSYLDRLLSVMHLSRANFELAGAAALYLACKVECHRNVKVQLFQNVMGKSFGENEMLEMENVILNKLERQLIQPVAHLFINNMSLILKDEYDAAGEVHNLALYVCELGLVAGDRLLRYPPSKMSAASIALARDIINMDMWTDKMARLTLFDVSEIKWVVRALNVCITMARTSQFQAVNLKYGT